MPAAPVMSMCTFLLPEVAGTKPSPRFPGRGKRLRSALGLTHGVQRPQARPLPALRVEILRREPALEGSLARRPFALEHGVIGGVAAAALRDHVSAQNTFEDEAVAHGGPARRCVEHIALPFVAPVAERPERVAREQVLRLGSERRALQ